MKDANLTTADLIGAYYRILATGRTGFDPEKLRAILAPDLLFQGTIAGQRSGAEPFIIGATGFATSARGMQMRHLLVSGDEAAALYDGELPGGTVRFAEFFRVRAGTIVSVELVYDASQYRSRGGS